MARGADSSADAEFEWLGSIVCLVLLSFCEILWYLVLLFLTVLKCVMGLWNGEFKRWCLCAADDFGADSGLGSEGVAALGQSLTALTALRVLDLQSEF